jgi:hypothetical protein
VPERDRWGPPRASRLFLARSLSQSALLLAISAVVVVLSALLGGLAGFFGLSSADGARAALAASAASDSGFRFATATTPDPAAQSRAADAVVARVLAELPVSVDVVHRSEPIPLAPGDGEQASVTFVAGAAVADRVAMAAGAAPGPDVTGTGVIDSEATGDGAIQAAIQADAAEALGLGVGDALELEPGADGTGVLNVVITGIWRAADPEDRFWFSDPGYLRGEPASGADGARVLGPLLVDETALAALPAATTVEWTLLPDPGAMTPDGLERVLAASAELQRELSDDPAISANRVRVSGGFDDTVARFARSENALLGVAPVGFVLLGLAGAIALGQLARLLALARRPDTALLRSRGASRARLLLLAAAEAVTIGALASGLGFAVAIGVLAARFGPSATGAVPPAVPFAVGALSIVIVTATAAVEARRPQRRETEQDSGRARTAVTLSTTGLALVAAVVAIAQSTLYGSPLVTDASGRRSVDPFGVLAPALGLVAAALVLLVAFGPIARLAERVAARRPGLQPAAGARQISRGLSGFAAAVLVITLSVGGLVLAATYSGSWTELGARTSALSVGADERVFVHEGRPALAAQDPIDLEAYRAIDGVDSAALVLDAGIAPSDRLSGGILTAMRAEDIRGVMTDALGLVDTPALSAALAGHAGFGIPIPDASGAFGMHAVLTARTPVRDGPAPVPATAFGTVWLEGDSGALTAAPFGPVTVGNGIAVPVTAGAELPPGSWSVVAVDLRAHGELYSVVSMEVTGFTSGAATEIPVEGGRWAGQLALYGVRLTDSGTTATFSSTPAGFTIGLSLQRATLAGARAMPESASAPLAGRIPFAGTAEPLRAFVSDAHAHDLVLGVGDDLDVALGGDSGGIEATVTAVVPQLPGSPGGPAVLVDLHALNEYLLRTGDSAPAANEVWLSTDGSPVDVADAAGPGVRVAVTTDGSRDVVLGTADTALWIAAIGCLLLAAISLGAVALALGRARRGDVVVLRALGVPDSRQAVGRLAELLAVCGVAVVFGGAAGVVVSALTVPVLSRSVVFGVPDGLDAALGVALAAGAVLLALGCAAFLLVALAHALGILRQARTTPARGEQR